LHHKRLDLRRGIEVQVVKMAHKISAIMIAAFATLAVASLIAMGASLVGGRGSRPIHQKRRLRQDNGQVARGNCTSAPQSGAQNATQTDLQ
jgi:hypothetical protein